MAQLNDLLVMGPSTLLGPINTYQSLHIHNGGDLRLRGSATGQSSDSGDIVFCDADNNENARVWWD